MIIPSPANPERTAKMPSPVTNTPADLKKRDEYFPCANEAEPKERNRSTGKVPRANASMIKTPEVKDPLETAATCIDWVNPQGRKKVPKPIKSGVKAFCSILLKKLKIVGDRETLFFLNIPIKFKPR